MFAHESDETQNTGNPEKEKSYFSVSRLYTCTFSEKSALKEISSHNEDAECDKTPDSRSKTDAGFVGLQNDVINTREECETADHKDAVVSNNETVEWIRGQSRSSDKGCESKPIYEDNIYSNTDTPIDNIDSNIKSDVSELFDDIDASEEFDSAESRKGSSSDTSEDTYKLAVPDQQQQEESLQADSIWVENVDSDLSQGLNTVTEASGEESKYRLESLKQVEMPKDYEDNDYVDIKGIDDVTMDVSELDSQDFSEVSGTHDPITNPRDDSTPDDKDSLAGLQETVVMRQTKARLTTKNTYSQGDELEKSATEQSKTESCVVS